MEKQIANPGQAFALGGTWATTAALDNAMTTEIAPLINNSGLVLYTGDIVSLDATGTQALVPSGAADAAVIGCVGSSREMGTATGTITGGVAGSNVGFTTTDGNFVPFEAVPWNNLTLGFTNGNGNITSASAATVNPLTVGLVVLTPYNASTNAAPQVFQIVSNGGSAGAWTAVGVVVSGAGTTFTGTTGPFSCQVGNGPQGVGPGFLPASIGQWTSSSLYVPGTVVPVIIRGFGRVNINGVAGTVAKDSIAAGGANVIGARTAAAAATAAQIGTFIATTLEAYAARDTTLTTAGITGHDSVRAIIGKY